MQVQEFQDELYKLAYTAEVNQRYHQLKQHQMWLWDKAVKIAVAVLAVFALVAVFFPHEWKWLEITAASIAAVAAIVLNVVPVGEWETHYGEMFRSWSDLLLSAEQLEMKSRELGVEQVPIHLVENLTDCVGRARQFDAMESAPNDRLLDQCQGDVNQRLFGPKVRTYEQAVAASQGTDR